MSEMATLWTCAGHPGLRALTRNDQGPPFGFPWNDGNRQRHPLYMLPKDETVAKLTRLIAEYNGDYEGKIGMTMAEYLWQQLTE